MTSLPAGRVDDLAALVDADDANNVLWHFFPRAPGIREPGSFIQALVAAIVRADPRNQLRLAYGFPGLVAATQIAQGNDDGINRLCTIAGAPPITTEETD